MLDPDKLEAVATVICHRNLDSPCPDGVASALLLRDALPEAKVRFVAYGSELAALAPFPGALFCDISPPATRAEEWLAAGALVLDHHRTAERVALAFSDAGRGVFADEKGDPGVSGAVLAYRHVWLPLRYPDGGAPGRRHVVVERFAALAGIRDTWQRESDAWRDACAQGEALAFWPWDAWPRDGFALGMSREMGAMLNLGYTLLEKREERTARIAAEGYRAITRRETRVLIVPTRETSDVAEALGAAVDLVVGFDFGLVDGRLPAMRLSTRSHAAFDCAAFCRAAGGGGHTRAAGAEILLSGTARNPYALVVEMLDAHEAGAASDRGAREP